MRISESFVLQSVPAHSYNTEVTLARGSGRHEAITKAGRAVNRARTGGSIHIMPSQRSEAKEFAASAK